MKHFLVRCSSQTVRKQVGRADRQARRGGLTSNREDRDAAPLTYTSHLQNTMHAYYYYRYSWNKYVCACVLSRNMISSFRLVGCSRIGCAGVQLRYHNEASSWSWEVKILRPTDTMWTREVGWLVGRSCLCCACAMCSMPSVEDFTYYFLGGMDGVMWLGGTRREVIELACVF